jgi:hypothetical protein
MFAGGPGRVAWLLLLSSLFGAGCQNKNPSVDYKSPQDESSNEVIPRKTVASYEKLGAEYGGLSVNPIGAVVFTRGEQAALRACLHSHLIRLRTAS